MRSTARRSSTRCGPAAPRCRRDCSGNIYGDMFHVRLDGAGLRSRTGATTCCKQAGYKGEPIPYRLLNNYYTNQVADRADPGRDVAPGRPQRADRDEGELDADHGAHAARARCATGRTRRRSAIRSPRSCAQHGPNGQQQQIGEWTNDEFNKLVGSARDLDRPRRRRSRLPPHARDRRARGPRLYGAAPERDLHRQAAVDSGGRLSPAFAMDFRAGNFGRPDDDRAGRHRATSTVGFDGVPRAARRGSRRPGRRGSRHWSANPAPASRSPGSPRSACCRGARGLHGQRHARRAGTFWPRRRPRSTAFAAAASP